MIPQLLNSLTCRSGPLPNPCLPTVPWADLSARVILSRASLAAQEAGSRPGGRGTWILAQGYRVEPKEKVLSVNQVEMD